MTTHTCIRILYCRVYPQLPPVIGARWGCCGHASGIYSPRPLWFGGCATHATPCSVPGYSYFRMCLEKSERNCLKACINDVRKIKIGKNQNQNWVLIGRGSKPPDYASLFFGNRCQTKEVPRDLNVYFLENKHWRCSPDRRLSECYTPEARAQQSYNSST